MGATAYDDDGVFRALADPTRRALLDALVELDGQSVSALAARFPDVTRFAVMKHLGVLEAANLVISHKAGRTRLLHLNPVPIHQIAGRWLDKYAVGVTRELLELKHTLESGD
ncbi:MAG: metalloregulator ArsR/SmtB family transcription factor [Nocardioides sp.]|uniref:ArsR/SmtB family transcription factor n=1 Tax=Nocardioides sp. TaxID=35761 RepID=UPI0039E24EC7